MTNRLGILPCITQISEIIHAGNYVVLDTETTGLASGSRICQIALVGPDAQTLLDSLVNPLIPIPPDAIRIHGITNEAVANAPTFNQLWPTIENLILNKTLLIYNAAYDVPRLVDSYIGDGSWSGPATMFLDNFCVMECYARVWGDWNNYHQSYTWQPLTRALQQQGLTWPDAPAHSALGDCLATLKLAKHLAAGGGQ